ncbi:LysR substrate binding domain-containing protein [Enterovibrio nigricans DSM 22720]|uniref:LysR substrate binding domain-containing protein n=2 Tax=Enterovibrio nigricans TaxID=504469 RepID=A0A1T4V1I7_9GAMM|nr:LysR substrate binding domain-containing protein [Enterovibrio nigricans DSM 22720]
MGKPPAELDLITTVFMENPLVVIAPIDHPFCDKQKIPLEAIAKEPMVVREQGSGTRFSIEKFFHNQGLSLNIAAEMTASEAIKQAVSAGLSLGIVSRHTIDLEIESKRLCILDVENFPILRHWYLVHRKEKRLSPIAEAFQHFVLENKKD